VRFLHVRRHTYTKKGEERGRGSHISQEGVDLARRVAQDLPAITLAVVSAAPRTLETAIAFGFAPIDAISYPDITEDTGIAFHEWWDMEQPFVRMRQLLETNDAVARVANVVTDAWRSVLDRLADGERALLIAHGGVMELGVAASIAATEGRAFAHCEGFELSYEDGVATDVQLLRL